MLGAAPGSLLFAWDNELPEHRAHVPAFEIDARPITNDDWAAFVLAGGYADARLWRSEDWAWRSRHALVQPHSWRAAGRAESPATGHGCAP